MVYRGIERDSREEVLHLQGQLQEQATAHDSKIAVLQAKTSRLIMGVLPRLGTSNQLPKSHPVHTDALTDQTAENQSPNTASGSGSGAAEGVTHTLSLGFNDASVQEHVLSILGRLCADDISEDEAVLQLSSFSHSLQMLAVTSTEPEQAPAAQATAAPQALETSLDATASEDAAGSVVEAVQADVSAEVEKAVVTEQQAAASMQASSSVAGTSSGRQSLEMPQTSGSSSHIYLSQVSHARFGSDEPACLCVLECPGDLRLPGRAQIGSRSESALTKFPQASFARHMAAV